jgi:hypothetical protein
VKISSKGFLGFEFLLIDPDEQVHRAASLEELTALVVNLRGKFPNCILRIKAVPVAGEERNEDIQNHERA